MTAGTAEKTLRSEDELRELAASGARELGAELDADGHVPAELKPARLLHHVGLVPQVPGDLLYAPTGAAECAR